MKFCVATYNADNKVIRAENGYRTRDDAERIAELRRRAIHIKGWNMSVEVIAFFVSGSDI